MSMYHIEKLPHLQIALCIVITQQSHQAGQYCYQLATFENTPSCLHRTVLREGVWVAGRQCRTGSMEGGTGETDCTSQVF